ncbi:MAG: patatin-like phospholipase family protein [bacterium]
MNASKIKHFCLLSALLGAPLAGCDDDEAAGEGTWGLSIYGEAFIEDGIPASAFADGWAVRFDHFYVVVSGLKAPGATFEGAYVFDLAQPSGGAGHPITEAMVAAGHHPTLGYAIRPVSAATPANVDAAVAEALVAGGFSMQIEGEATRGDEARRFALALHHRHHLHGLRDRPAPADGGRIESQLTIHADHLFYDDLDSAEPDVAFDPDRRSRRGRRWPRSPRRSWPPSTSPPRSATSGRAPSRTQRFIEQQATTVGHIDGEGTAAESPPSRGPGLGGILPPIRRRPHARPHRSPARQARGRRPLQRLLRLLWPHRLHEGPGRPRAAACAGRHVAGRHRRRIRRQRRGPRPARRPPWPAPPPPRLLGSGPAPRHRPPEGRAVRALLARHLPAERFEDLDTPLVVVNTDLVHRCRRVDTTGPAGAVRSLASCALPLMFRAVELDGRPHVDGGLLDKVPVRAPGAPAPLDVLLVHLLPSASLSGPFPRDPWRFVNAALDLVRDDAWRLQAAWAETQGVEVIGIETALPRLGPFRLGRGPAVVNEAEAKVGAVLDAPG